MLSKQLGCLLLCPCSILMGVAGTSWGKGSGTQAWPAEQSISSPLGHSTGPGADMGPKLVHMLFLLGLLSCQGWIKPGAAGGHQEGAACLR